MNDVSARELIVIWRGLSESRQRMLCNVENLITSKLTDNGHTLAKNRSCYFWPTIVDLGFTYSEATEFNFEEVRENPGDLFVSEMILDWDQTFPRRVDQIGHTCTEIPSFLRESPLSQWIQMYFLEKLVLCLGDARQPPVEMLVEYVNQEGGEENERRRKRHQKKVREKRQRKKTRRKLRIAREKEKDKELEQKKLQEAAKKPRKRKKRKKPKVTILRRPKETPKEKSEWRTVKRNRHPRSGCKRTKIHHSVLSDPQPMELDDDLRVWLVDWAKSFSTYDESETSIRNRLLPEFLRTK